MAILNRLLGKDEMIKAERVNLLYITLGDIESDKNYLAKCVCGHRFNVNIYIMDDLKKREDLNKSVIKQDSGCYHMLGTIHKTVGLYFDKNAAYINVSWNCAQCRDKITIFVTRFF
jgi:ATP sulfurylase